MITELILADRHAQAALDGDLGLADPLGVNWPRNGRAMSSRDLASIKIAPVSRAPSGNCALMIRAWELGMNEVLRIQYRYCRERRASAACGNDQSGG